MHHNQTSLLIHVARGYHLISPLLFFREVATVWLAPDSALLSHPHYIFTLRYPRTQWYTCAHISLTRLFFFLCVLIWRQQSVCGGLKWRQSACLFLPGGHWWQQGILYLQTCTKMDMVTLTGYLTNGHIMLLSCTNTPTSAACSWVLVFRSHIHLMNWSLPV